MKKFIAGTLVAAALSLLGTAFLAQDVQAYGHHGRGYHACRHYNNHRYYRHHVVRRFHR